MLIVIFGESCTGKSTLARQLQQRFGGALMTGKDYLRLAKNESTARQLFQKKLEAAVDGDNLIYVITEKAHLTFVPEGAVRILASADLETIKARFAQRMHGTLPGQVAAMLERNHGAFDTEKADYNYCAEESDLHGLLSSLQKRK